MQYGLISQGNEERDQAVKGLSLAADQENQRNITNQQIQEQAKAGKAALGSTVGSTVGAAIGSSIAGGAAAGSSAGPYGMAAGAIIGAIAGAFGSKLF